MVRWLILRNSSRGRRATYSMTKDRRAVVGLFDAVEISDVIVLQLGKGARFVFECRDGLGPARVGCEEPQQR